MIDIAGSALAIILCPLSYLRVVCEGQGIFMCLKEAFVCLSLFSCRLRDEQDKIGGSKDVGTRSYQYIPKHIYNQT